MRITLCQCTTGMCLDTKLSSDQLGTGAPVGVRETSVGRMGLFNSGDELLASTKLPFSQLMVI